MKFGVTMFPNNLEDVARGARLAEEMGFDYVGVADSQSLARELYVTLGVVAASTERVMLGPTVSNPLTRHPAVAASAIASINELSKGRAFLGLGSGDSAVLNLGLRPARLAELHHYIQSVREMLAGETSRVSGRPRPRPLVCFDYAQHRHAHRHVRRGAAHPSNGRLRRRRRHHPHGPDHRLAAGHHSPHPRGRARRRGGRKVRRGSGPSPSATLPMTAPRQSRKSRWPWPPQGHHAFRFTLEGKNVPEQYREAVSVLHREYEAAEHEQVGETRNATLTDELGLTDYFADRFAIVGTPEECRDKTRATFDTGVDVLLITAIGPSPETIIRRYGEEVIAPLRGE